MGNHFSAGRNQHHHLHLLWKIILFSRKPQWLLKSKKPVGGFGAGPEPGRVDAGPI